LLSAALAGIVGNSATVADGPSAAAGDSDFAKLTDDLNAYEFKYPLVSAKTKQKLPW
jgi:hypothetical protein